MRIEDAIQQARYATNKLTGTEKVAVLCLIRVARHVVKLRQPLKDMSEALDTDLNQESLLK